MTVVRTQVTPEQAIEELDRPQVEEIANAEIAIGRRTSSPTSVRLSAPLLAALEQLATVQHRSRGNLIQHILWEYVQRHKDDQ